MTAPCPRPPKVVPKSVAVSFFLLAPYITVQAVRDLATGHATDASTLGIVVTAASLLLMPALGVVKRGPHATRGVVLPPATGPRGGR